MELQGVQDIQIAPFFSNLLYTRQGVDRIEGISDIELDTKSIV
jgi:hypothetical protein